MRNAVACVCMLCVCLALPFLCSCGERDDAGRMQVAEPGGGAGGGSATGDASGRGSQSGEPSGDAAADAGAKASLRDAFAKALSDGAPADAQAGLLSRLDRLHQQAAPSGSVLHLKQVPLLIMADEVDEYDTKDAGVMTAAKTKRDLNVIDLPVILAALQSGRQNGIDFSPVRLVGSGESFADHLGQLQPQPQHALLIRSSPRGSTSFGAAGGLQATFAHLFVLDVSASTFVDDQNLLSMAVFEAAHVQDGKVSVSILTSQAIEGFLRNVGGIGLGKLQHALHGDTIGNELAKCAALPDIKAIEPQVGKKKGGQVTNTQIAVGPGDFVVYLDAPEGSPDRCWQLNNEPLTAELTPGVYSIYVQDRTSKAVHGLRETQLEKDKEYALLK